MKGVRMDGDTCPHCGAFVDASASASGDADIPSPGDVSVCFYCAGVCVFNDDMKREKADLDALAKESPETVKDIVEAQALVLKRQRVKGQG
jgi:hypothetical protein